MKEREFFIDILKATPNNSIIETTGYIEPKIANEFELISFEKFTPNSVELKFTLNSKNLEKWIYYFKTAEISDLITHYWIYKDNCVIASGFDFFMSNEFDKHYYADKFNQYKSSFEIDYSFNLSNGLPTTETKKIEFIKVKENEGFFSAEIIMEVNNEFLPLKFAIEKKDFKVFMELENELKKNEKLVFNGGYLDNKNYPELELKIKSEISEIGIMVNSSKKLVSNLLWFQGIKKKKEIEKLIIKAHNNQ